MDLKRKALKLHRSKREDSTNERGFTLVEIAVSVVILGLALTVLVGLQTQVMESHYIEENITRSSLYARYLLTMIEVRVSKEQPPLGETKKGLYSALDEWGYFDLDKKSDAREQLRDWEVKTYIESIDALPILGFLRRIEMTISWGDAPGQQYVVEYFIKSRPEAL